MRFQRDGESGARRQRRRVEQQHRRFEGRWQLEQRAGRSGRGHILCRRDIVFRWYGKERRHDFGNFVGWGDLGCNDERGRNDEIEQYGGLGWYDEDGRGDRDWRCERHGRGDQDGRHDRERRYDKRGRHDHRGWQHSGWHDCHGRHDKRGRQRRDDDGQVQFFRGQLRGVAEDRRQHEGPGR